MSFKETVFESSGRSLAVRIMPIEDGFAARVFEGDRPVTGVIYTAKFETILASESAGHNGVLESLAGIAKDDVMRGWVRLLP